MKNNIWITSLVLLLLTSCTDGVSTTRILSEQGYVNIQITGVSGGCGEDDFYSTGFTALSLAKKNVSGVVCGGGLKGFTIRLR